MGTRSKEAEEHRRAYDTVRRTVIRELGLTGDEVVRMSTLDVNDPLSAYAGNMIVHARLIFEDRHEIPSNIILGEE